MKTPAELESLINNSPLFSIDRKRDVTEERRFLANLAELMKIVRKDFKEIGYEIITTAKDCVNAYNADRGAFLNYFNSSLSKTVRTAKAKERANKCRGSIKLDQKTERTIRKILKLAMVRGKDIYDSSLQKDIAKILDIPLEEIVEAISINDEVAVSDTIPFDLIDSRINTPEDIFAQKDSICRMLVSIETVFQQQEKTNPLLSQLLTARLLPEILEIEIFDNVFSKTTFLDSEIYNRYKSDGNVPTAREIAEKFGVHEASASRTLKTFLEKVLSSEKTKLYKSMKKIAIFAMVM